VSVNNQITQWLSITYVCVYPQDANLDLRVGLGKTLDQIGSIPTSWSWTYTSASSDLVADVSYDLWLSNVAGTGGASSTSTFEVYVYDCGVRWNNPNLTSGLD